ncbi:MAG: RraA family protein [Actinomycetota bacterium]|nr:MAG: RraA family protein [Actinomycetota bacterium]
MDHDLVTQLSTLPCSSISDALDRLGILGSAIGIAPLVNGLKLAGPAYTIRYAPVRKPAGTVGDYIEDVEPGSVIVLDNYGRTDCTVWGDILTTIALSRGIAGTAINGVCRDVHKAIETGYPIYSKGRFMRTGKDRVEVVEIGGAVTLGDVQVRASDIIVGDDDGVVIVPQNQAHAIIAVATEISQKESAIVSDALAMRSLRDSRSKHGYHSLQSSNEPKS